MAETKNSTAGEWAYFGLAIGCLAIAIGSVVWVLAAPAANDDQGVRATFAGLAVGIFAALLMAGSALLGLRKRRTRSTRSKSVEGKNVNQINMDTSQGFIGGTHFHGDRNTVPRETNIRDQS